MDNVSSVIFVDVWVSWGIKLYVTVTRSEKNYYEEAGVENTPRKTTLYNIIPLRKQYLNLFI